jgi:hypothetical protein
MNLDFDYKNFDAQCPVSDKEWEMILLSGTFVKTGKVCHTIYKRQVLTFMFKNGNVELLNQRKVPSPKYSLPLLDNTVSFNKRAAVYLEREQLRSGRQLDDGNWKIYGT